MASNLGICHKLRKETIKFESYLATYRFFPSDMGPQKKFERGKKWRFEMIRTTLPGCALVDKISYGFRCFRLRSSRWDSLPAHVLMKSEHIPANQCIPLQASVHIIVSIPLYYKEKIRSWLGVSVLNLFVCLSVCRSVCQPASQPACLPACRGVCVCGGGVWVGVCVCVCVFFLSFSTQI